MLPGSGRVQYFAEGRHLTAGVKGSTWELDKDGSLQWLENGNRRVDGDRNGNRARSTNGIRNGTRGGRPLEVPVRKKVNASRQAKGCFDTLHTEGVVECRAEERPGRKAQLNPKVLDGGPTQNRDDGYVGAQSNAENSWV
jgi:hypothetical protein